MLLQVLLFVVFFTATLLQYSYVSSSFANNTNRHIAENNISGFVTLDQLSAYAVMDLTGGIVEGSYHVTLALGPHAHQYTFTIDSGSDLTWVNCERNSHYHYPHQPYKPPIRRPVLCGNPICRNFPHPKEHPCRSATDKCYYKIEYSDGAKTTGDMIEESLSLPFINVHHSLRHPLIAIGCGNHNYHPPISTVNRTGHTIAFDGIMGLAKESSSTIWDQLDKKGITRSVFGHCMARLRGGYFFIGAGKPLPSHITWARMVTVDKDDRIYSAGRAKIIVDTNFSLPNLHTFFDSGSTYSYLPRSALQALIVHVERYFLLHTPLRPSTKPGYHTCWYIPEHKIRSLDEVAAYIKTMNIIFSDSNNARFELPLYTFLTVQNSGGHICLTIFNSADIGMDGFLVLGEYFFQNKLVVYDVVGKRIGWADSHCEHTRMNDLKPLNVIEKDYNVGDLPAHRFSSNMPGWRKRGLLNYTTVNQTMK